MIKILFFAGLQEEISSDSLMMESAEATVQEVKRYVQSIYPNVDLQQILTSVNEEFSNGDDIVKSGDIIAFLPPVSGG